MVSGHQQTIVHGSFGSFKEQCNGVRDSHKAGKIKGPNQEKKKDQKTSLSNHERCRGEGIWSRDASYKSNSPLTEIKILENLESKKLITAVKSVAASKKEVFMLYNLQPDLYVAGGAWYEDQDFESEFVEVLN